MKDANKRRTKKMLDFDQKEDIKTEKYITPMEFAEYIRKADVSENSKIYCGRFQPNGLHERNCYISKSRWDVQYL